MATLKDLYKDLEKRSNAEITQLVFVAINDVIEELKKYDADTRQLFAGFIFTVVGSDGKVRPEEFRIVKPIMDGLFNMDSTIDDAKELILKYGFKDKDAKRETSRLMDVIGSSNPDLRVKMITLAVYISAIDGDVSRKEKAFIESLF